ncbi:hypothetical protein TNCV_1439451 [Trichonephila clavipes]|nr:hypothetical protein TNCV_1439451 [Trichonephila clavipes]
MVWTISLEELLISRSILQGSKDLRFSNFIVKSEKNSIWIIPPWSSFRSPAPHSKKPTKEHLFRIGIVAAMFQKRRPCNSQTKRTGNDSSLILLMEH